MRLPIEKHIEFYDKQLLFLEEEWKRYSMSKVTSLWKDKKLFIGRIWGFDKKRGHLILRFKRGALPRLKVPYQLCLVASSAGSNHLDWHFSYNGFREDHSIISTRINPVFHLKPENDWRFIGCGQVSKEFMHQIEDSLENRIHPLIVVAQEDPPYKYLENLKHFVINNPKNKVINLDSNKSISEWNPRALPHHDVLTSHVISIVEKNSVTVIQGPPGTGKTHLVSELCRHFSRENKSICVTATTNKTLIEIAGKEALNELREQGKIIKVNLSPDEEKKLPKIKGSDEPVAIPAHIVFATYYLLSNELKEIEFKRNKFDIIVIEEASQATLAAIAGFVDLGMKAIIVGDPMQLFPIISNPKECDKIHPSVHKAIRGLETFSINHENLSYRINDTYRLTEEAANQSGEFYKNQLISVSTLNPFNPFKTSWANLFCKKGGTSILKLSMMDLESSKGVDIAIRVAIDIKNQNPSFEIAILSNLKKTVDKLYDAMLLSESNITDFEVETIDRIQGLTTDVTILLLESSIQFGLQLNRFNVSTSRAKRGTLIITGEQIDLLRGIDPLVVTFLKKTKTVSL